MLFLNTGRDNKEVRLIKCPPEGGWEEKESRSCSCRRPSPCNVLKKKTKEKKKHQTVCQPSHTFYNRDWQPFISSPLRPVLTTIVHQLTHGEKNLRCTVCAFLRLLLRLINHHYTWQHKHMESSALLPASVHYLIIGKGKRRLFHTLCDLL